MAGHVIKLPIERHLRRVLEWMPNNSRRVKDRLKGRSLNDALEITRGRNRWQALFAQ